MPFLNKYLWLVFKIDNIRVLRFYKNHNYRQLSIVLQS